MVQCLHCDSNGYIGCFRLFFYEKKVLKKMKQNKTKRNEQTNEEIMSIESEEQSSLLYTQINRFHSVKVNSSNCYFTR